MASSALKKRVQGPEMAKPPPVSMDFEKVETVFVTSFKADRICTQCGLWQTEHDYESCVSPEWQ